MPGFKLRIEPSESTERTYLALGISKERIDLLTSVVSTSYDNIDMTFEAMKDIASYCESPEELAYACYMYGQVVTAHLPAEYLAHMRGETKGEAPWDVND